MRVDEFLQQSKKIKSNSNRTIQVSSPPKQVGLKQEDLDIALGPLRSNLVEAENFSKTAFSRTTDFQNDLVELTKKINMQNIKMDKIEKLNSSLMEHNLKLQIRLDTLTALVENGPLFSSGVIDGNREPIGLIPNMKNLGTGDMSLFSMEMNSNGN